MNKEQRMKMYLLKWGSQGGKQPSVLSRTPSAPVNRLHFGCFQSINCGSAAEGCLQVCVFCSPGNKVAPDLLSV